MEWLAEQRLARTTDENRMQRTISVIALAVALDWSTAGAQSRRPNLVESARRQGDLNIMSQACGFVGGPPTLNGLIQSADIILYGTVVAAEGRLSDDLSQVWTDYRVEPFEVLRSHPLAEARVLPFTVLGGVVLVEGHQITYRHEQSGQRLSMTVGQEVVVFGALREKGQRFHVTAVFPVVGRWATSDGELNGFDAAGAPVEQFLESIRAVAGVAPTQRNPR